MGKSLLYLEYCLCNFCCLNDLLSNSNKQLTCLDFERARGEHKSEIWLKYVSTVYLDSLPLKLICEYKWRLGQGSQSISSVLQNGRSITSLLLVLAQIECIYGLRNCVRDAEAEHHMYIDYFYFSEQNLQFVGMNPGFLNWDESCL